MVTLNPGNSIFYSINDDVLLAFAMAQGEIVNSKNLFSAFLRLENAAAVRIADSVALFLEDESKESELGQALNPGSKQANPRISEDVLSLLQRAFREADRVGQAHIGIEHMLLAMVNASSKLTAASKIELTTVLQEYVDKSTPTEPDFVRRLGVYLIKVRQRFCRSFNLG